jgi:hypothetical protein
MRILLSPDKAHSSVLFQLYGKAFREAKELLVATAYLTSWDLGHKLGLQCKKVLFLVGTDFGRTRKSACRQVLKWLPRDCLTDFLAVTNLEEGSFHPKLIAWKVSNEKYYGILGSSNLSKAAFDSNVEANVFTSLTPAEYLSIKTWLLHISEATQPVTTDWLDYHYEEAAIQGGHGRKEPTARGFVIKLPSGGKYSADLADRRRKQAAFAQIRSKLLKIIRDCSAGKISNNLFWEKFWQAWSKHPSRFQGSGLQFTAKSANWNDACRSFNEIIVTSKHSPATLDQTVATEINRLSRLRNPVRGAWLTEMLCHFFPTQYPLINAPVYKWLTAIKWRGRKGISKGQRYIDLARQMREAIRQNPKGPKNLAELDSVIWNWAQSEGK